MVAPIVASGGVCVWRESGVRRSDWCLADAVNILWHLFYFFLKKLYNFRTFNVIFKNNAGVNCIAVQQKKVYFRQRLRVIYYTR
jgi:hypothetical protein